MKHGLERRAWGWVLGGPGITLDSSLSEDIVSFFVISTSASGLALVPFNLHFTIINLCNIEDIEQESEVRPQSQLYKPGDSSC